MEECELHSNAECGKPRICEASDASLEVNRVETCFLKCAASQNSSRDVFTFCNSAMVSNTAVRHCFVAAVDDFCRCGVVEGVLQRFSPG